MYDDEVIIEITDNKLTTIIHGCNIQDISTENLEYFGNLYLTSGYEVWINGLQVEEVNPVIVAALMTRCMIVMN